jgi:hypothetical protein
MDKNYNAIRLKNGVQNAVSEALADIAILGLEHKIKAYKDGVITAEEFLTYMDSLK